MGGQGPWPCAVPDVSRLRTPAKDCVTSVRSQAAKTAAQNVSTMTTTLDDAEVRSWGWLRGARGLRRGVFPQTR